MIARSHRDIIMACPYYDSIMECTHHDIIRASTHRHIILACMHSACYHGMHWNWYHYNMHWRWHHYGKHSSWYHCACTLQDTTMACNHVDIIMTSIHRDITMICTPHYDVIRLGHSLTMTSSQIIISAWHALGHVTACPMADDAACTHHGLAVACSSFLQPRQVAGLQWKRWKQLKNRRSTEGAQVRAGHNAEVSIFFSAKNNNNSRKNLLLIRAPKTAFIQFWIHYKKKYKKF